MVLRLQISLESVQVVMPKTLIPLAAIKVESADRRQAWNQKAVRKSLQLFIVY